MEASDTEQNNSQERGGLVAYGVALAAVAGAVVLRRLLDPALHDAMPFTTFYVAVAIAACVGGLRPALLATGLGALLSRYLFIDPRFSLLDTTGLILIRLSMFAVASLSIAAFGAMMRAAQQRTRHSEAVARQHEQLLRLTFASVAEGIITTRANGDVQDLNAAATDLTGWTREVARGKPLKIVFTVIDEQTRQPAEVGPSLTNGQQLGLASNTVLVSKDGTERPIEANAAPIHDPQGKVLGTVWVFHDLTQRRESEVKLREAQARVIMDLADRKRMQEAVQLSEELKQAQEALGKADRCKDEFLAMLAHELRNPLAPIRNAVQILRLQKSVLPEQQWATDVIDRQLMQITRLVEDLLDVSRITRDKLELRKERVELAAVVHGAVEVSRPLIEQFHHELTVTLPPEPIVLYADPTRLGQVFSNLLNNAAKYTKRGGQIWLTVRQKGSDVVVSVKDTGIGIPPQMLPQVFEMFTQVDRRLERSQGGLGVGLALAKRLVELHRGSIEARCAALDEGSEFIVRLPVVSEPDPAQLAPASDPTTALPAPLRILVADDNQDSACSLGMILQFMGHDIRTAYDGLAAVKVAQEFHPDVALLDLGMPGLNGYDACRRIHEQPWGQGMLLIALTGWGQTEDRRRTKEAGFAHHLVKPMDPDVLLQLLAQWQTSRAGRA